MTWQSDTDRFFAKVRQTYDPFGCWLWGAAIDAATGYGRFKLGGRLDMAHRAAWLLLRGPIPAGLHLDHLCRVRACVNPWHLEPVTIRVNTLRGNSPVAVAWRTDTCHRGHDLREAYTDGNGHRDCRACRRQRQLAYDRKRRAQRRADRRTQVA